MKKMLQVWVALTLSTWPPALAQEKARELLQVHCVDADSKPVEGAEVHVWQARKMPDDRYEQLASGPFTSGDDGVASTVQPIDYDGGRFSRMVYARVPGKLVGAQRVFRFDDSPVDAKLVVALLPSRELRGRVKVPDGVRPETVRIHVRTLSRIVDDNLWGQVFPRQMGLPGLEDTLPERFDCQAAKDGTFLLADVPLKPLVVLAATGPGLQQVLWGNALLPERSIPASIEFELLPESRFGGVLTDARSLPVVGAEVELRMSKLASGPATASFLARTDAVGHFLLDGLPAGPFELFVRSPAGVLRPQRVNLAQAESKLDAKVELEEGIEVAGIVAALPGGEPVASVVVMAIVADDLMQQLGHSRTDPLGRFSMRLPTGKAKLYFGGLPRGFAYPEQQIVATLDIAPGDSDLKKLTLGVRRLP